MLGGCSKDKPDRRGAPPPPAASAPAAACANGGGTIQDPTSAAAFPRTLDNYCVDPRGETRLYGQGAPKPLDAICTEAFNGECEVYKGFGLERVSLFRYVDGQGSTGSIDVIVSKFTTQDGSYGMFTKRVISEADPAREGAPQKLDVPGQAALGTGTAYLWKGPLFVELTYTNENQTPQQIAATGDTLLRKLVGEVAKQLPGTGELPASAAQLPADQRVPLGIQYEPKDAFEVQGAGAGAVGFYQDQGKRYRVLSIVRDDPEQAKDVLTSLGKREGASAEKGIGEGAVRLMVGQEPPRAEWIVARQANRIVGIGDEPLVLQPNMSAAERDKLTLSKAQKTERLRTVLQTSR